MDFKKPPRGRPFSKSKHFREYHVVGPREKGFRSFEDQKEPCDLNETSSNNLEKGTIKSHENNARASFSLAIPAKINPSSAVSAQTRRINAEAEISSFHFDISSEADMTKALRK